MNITIKYFEYSIFRNIYIFICNDVMKFINNWIKITYYICLLYPCRNNFQEIYFAHTTNIIYNLRYYIIVI